MVSSLCLNCSVDPRVSRQFKSRMRITIAFNPVSGRGNAAGIARDLEAALQDAGHVVQQVASQPGDGDWITPALDNAQALLVVGGDGTVRSIAQYAARAQVPMLHVPLGTENLLARGFGMRRDTAAVVNAIDNGPRVPIDLARANGEPMLLMASAGLDAAVVADVSHNRGSSISKWTYMYALRRCIRTFRTPVMKVEVDGRTVVDNIQGWVVVANSPDYGSRLDPAPQSKLDDGLLDVVFLPCRTRLGFATWVVLARLRLHLRRKRAVVAMGRSVTITFDAPTPVQFDGDAPHVDALVEQLNVALMPEQLSVIVPSRTKAYRALAQSPADAST